MIPIYPRVNFACDIVPAHEPAPGPAAPAILREHVHMCTPGVLHTHHSNAPRPAPAHARLRTAHKPAVLHTHACATPAPSSYSHRCTPHVSQPVRPPSPWPVPGYAAPAAAPIISTYTGWAADATPARPYYGAGGAPPPSPPSLAAFHAAMRARRSSDSDRPPPPRCSSLSPGSLAPPPSRAAFHAAMR